MGAHYFLFYSQLIYEFVSYRYNLCLWLEKQCKTRTFLDISVSDLQSKHCGSITKRCRENPLPRYRPRSQSIGSPIPWWRPASPHKWTETGKQSVQNCLQGYLLAGNNRRPRGGPPQQCVLNLPRTTRQEEVWFWVAVRRIMYCSIDVSIEGTKCVQSTLAQLGPVSCTREQLCLWQWETLSLGKEERQTVGTALDSQGVAACQGRQGPTAHQREMPSATP